MSDNSNTGQPLERSDADNPTAPHSSLVESSAEQLGVDNHKESLPPYFKIFFDENAQNNASSDQPVEGPSVEHGLSTGQSDLDPKRPVKKFQYRIRIPIKGTNGKIYPLFSSSRSAFHSRNPPLIYAKQDVPKKDGCSKPIWNLEFNTNLLNNPAVKRLKNNFIRGLTKDHKMSQKLRVVP